MTIEQILEDLKNLKKHNLNNYNATPVTILKLLEHLIVICQEIAVKLPKE